MSLKSIFFNFLLIIFASSFALIIVEVLLRFNNQGPWGNLDNSRDDPTINRPDKKLGWVPQKGKYKFEPFSEGGSPFTINILGLQLTPVRVDRLSLLFGYIFHIAAIISIIYAFHLRDTVQQIAALMYAGTAIGGIFAGDLVSLFVYWEGTAISSVFLIGPNEIDLKKHDLYPT